MITKLLLSFFIQIIQKSQQQSPNTNQTETIVNKEIADCLTWFDGCNNCKVINDGEELICG